MDLWWAHVTMTYNVINTIPTMATNTTHLTDPLTSASMSCLDLSNMSVRHLPVRGAGAGSLPFCTPPVPFSMSYAAKPLTLPYQFFVTCASTGRSACLLVATDGQC